MRKYICKKVPITHRIGFIKNIVIGGGGLFVCLFVMVKTKKEKKRKEKPKKCHS